MARLAGVTATFGAILALAGAFWLPATGVAMAGVDRWALAVLAVAFWAFGFSLKRGAAAFGLLAFVFVIGGAAQLYLTEALWFPTLHLRPKGAGEWLAAGLIVVEALVVAGAALRLGPGRMIAMGRARLGLGRIALYLALTTVFSVPILGYLSYGSLPNYLAHVIAGGALLALHLGMVILMVQVPSPMNGATRTMPVLPAVVAVAAGLAMGWFAFERMPHVEDEVAYLFQAQTFAHGALTLPAPPEAAMPGLDYYLIEVKDGRWFSATLPGWPAVLALGVLLGLPWLVNPLLAGVSVLLAYDITRRRAGVEAGDMVALLLGTSPWLAFAAGSLMPHVLTLSMILLAWWLILRAEDGARAPGRKLVIAGLAIGVVFAARPMDGLVIGVLTGLWVLTGRDRGILRAVQFSAGALAVVAALLAYNAHITGDALVLPLSDYLDRHWAPGANAYGFGPQIGPPGGWGALDLWPGHGALEAALNTVNSVVSLQFDMLGWPIGSLALIFAYLLWSRKAGFDLAMGLVSIVVIGVMALYWFADTYYMGPRYWFLAIFPFLYLSMRGYRALRERFGISGAQGVRLDAVIALCCAFGILVFTPWRGVTKYYEYNHFYTLFRDEAAKGAFGDAVVVFTDIGNEGSALMLNDPYLRPGKPVFLWDSGTLDMAALKAAFPGRDILHFTPDWAPGR